MRLLLAVMVVVVVVAGTAANVASKKSHKKANADADKKHLDIEKTLKEIDEELELERELAAEEEEEMEEEASDEENEMLEEEEEEEEAEGLPAEYYPLEPKPDPCLEMYCSAGRMCVVNDDGAGECVCVNACEEEDDARRRVCSNFNETWMSDCELYRQRCLCQEEDDSCLTPQNKHVHIEYYGACQAIPVCDEEELEDFPRRMSEWLFQIMRDMADRETLSEHYIGLEREAEEDPKKQWSYAVVWKWCDLDSHPRDKVVSRHELFPLRAPLFTLENCVATFLDSCDDNDDHAITLREWAACTKLSQDDLEKFETFCENMREE